MLGKHEAICCLMLLLTLHSAPAFADNIEKSGPLTVQTTDDKSSAGVTVWLETSLKRVFMQTEPGSTNLNLLAPRNGKIAFQVCMRNRTAFWQQVECSINAPKDVRSQVRLVDFVPVRHFTGGTDRNELDGIGILPGLVPDPLLPRTSVDLGTQETRSFWITLNVPSEVQPGIQELTVKLSFRQLFVGNKENKKVDVEIPVRLEVSPFVIQARHDFSVTHWWSADSLYCYYKCKPFDERWYAIVQPYLKDMLDHGSDVLYVPVFYMRREIIDQPSQLLIVNEPKRGQYQFDWSSVRRFVELGKQIGFKKFEWTHLWVYWGLDNPIRVYTERDGKMALLWPENLGGFSD